MMKRKFQNTTTKDEILDICADIMEETRSKNETIEKLDRLLEKSIKEIHENSDKNDIKTQEERMGRIIENREKIADEWEINKNESRKIFEKIKSYRFKNIHSISEQIESLRIAIQLYDKIVMGAKIDDEYFEFNKSSLMYIISHSEKYKISLTNQKEINNMIKKADKLLNKSNVYQN